MLRQAILVDRSSKLAALPKYWPQPNPRGHILGSVPGLSAPSSLMLGKAAVTDAEKPTQKRQMVVTTPKLGTLRMKVLGFSATTLIPGRFNLKFGNVMWPQDVEVRLGETTTIKPGTIRVSSNVGALYFAVRNLDGQEVGKGASPGHKLTLPPGPYILDLDTDKTVKTLTDAQRQMNVELKAGEEIDIEVQ